MLVAKSWLTTVECCARGPMSMVRAAGGAWVAAARAAAVASRVAAAAAGLKHLLSVAWKCVALDWMADSAQVWMI